MIGDSLRAKLNVIMVAAVAFGLGLGLSARLDLTPGGMASSELEPPRLQIGAPEGQNPDVTLADGFAGIAESVSPAVVTVRVEQTVQAVSGNVLPPGLELPPGIEGHEDRLRMGSGSGFIISEDGYIITNNHVVQDAENITIQLADRREFDNVRLVGRDATTDVALLKVEASGLPVAPLGDSEQLRVGEWVVAIGSPGFGFVGSGRDLLTTTVTAGIVSAKGRSIGILNRQFNGPSLAIEDFIQTDAAINPGNSGGPLVNTRGEVVGINTAIASTTGNYVGYGFAVPMDLVREVIDDLVEHGEVHRAILGIGVRAIDDEDAEAYRLDEVAGVKVLNFSVPGEDGSPAERAGIREGDVILAVNGEPVRTVSGLQRKIRKYEPGETVDVALVRRANQTRDNVQVKLMAAPSPEAAEEPRMASAASSDPIGIEVGPISDEFRREYDLSDDIGGVVITDSDLRGALGRKAPMRTRLNGRITQYPWLVRDVNGEEVESPSDYERVVSSLEPGSVANLSLYDPVSGNTLFPSIRIPSDSR